jgi:molybdenum cofactor cytidylyltransferase
LSWRRIAHVHLCAAALTADLQPNVSHNWILVHLGERAHSPGSSRSFAGSQGDQEIKSNIFLLISRSPCADLPTSIAPIVLAAGESTRMGSPKALLRDSAGRTFVARILGTLAAAGFTDATVVTGSLHAAIVAAVAAEGAGAVGLTIHFVRNADPSQGQLSSLLVGLDHVSRPGVTAAMVTLVDVPLLSAGTIHAVVEAYCRSRAPIVRPVHAELHGHPVIFDAGVFNELRAADPAQGAKAVLRAHEREILNVPVDDAGALADIDTPEDYRKAVLSSTASREES